MPEVLQRPSVADEVVRATWSAGELDRLPSCLAIPLRDLNLEEHSRMGLHRVCDIAEIPGPAGERRAHSAGIDALGVTPDDARVVSAGADHRTRVWNLETGALECDFEGAPPRPEELAIDREGEWLAASATDGLLIWEIASGQLCRSLPDESGRAGVVLPVTRSLVASGGADGVLRLWNVDAQRRVWEADGAAGTILSMAVDDVRGRIVTDTEGGLMAIWNLEAGQLLARWWIDAPVTSVCVASAGRAFFGDAGGQVLALDLVQEVS